MTCPSKSRNVAMATSKLGVTVPCVTGALGTDEISVHHVWSWSAGTFTTSSSLLVCSSKVILLEDISTKLYRLANIEEVTNVMVQDYTPEIMSILSYNVTGSVFHVEWTTNIQNGVTFHLVLLNETNEIQNLTVVSYNWTFTDLSPAILYTVRVTPAACGNEGTTKEIKVRTGKYNSSPGYVTVNIRRDVLKDNNIPESSLYLGKPDCGLSGADNTYVWLTTSWKMCGTTFANNGTHNFANVTLYNNVSGLSSLRLEVPVICTYPSRFFISTGYAPSGYFDIINDPVAGSGSFQVILRLLNGTFPLPDDYIFSPEEEVFLEVEVNTTISQVNVIIDTCWATSSNDSTKPPQDFFMEKGCPASNAYTTVLQNGNGTVSLLSVQIFKFVKQYIIYLHCQIQICVEIQQGSCRSDILSTDNLFLFVFLKTSVQRAASNTLQTIGFVLLGIGVFLLSLAVIAGLAYHKRKIGNYNFRFKPQQQNFTYHVFDT
ncbi:uromodulin-like 1 [Labeo rohita]|uniref:Uromodulin-like 1 n=1 Tax=Labeo rohita TaxID=84645 RepID=A0A498N7A9_LABRO|nr:uromodulin-like 1 [Labeo rohita]